MAHLVSLKEIEYGVYGDLIMVLGDSRIYDPTRAMVCCLGLGTPLLDFRFGAWGFGASTLTSILVILNS